MNNNHLKTKLAHAGENALGKKIANGVSVPKVLPIYMSSVFSFDDVPSLDAYYAKEVDGYIYSRNGNPSTDAAAEMLAVAEGAEAALTFSSGMAAITSTILAYVGQGDHIVSSPVLYGGAYDFMKNELLRFGVETTFVNFEDLEAVKAAVRPNTKVFYTETISNPLMEVMDLPAVAKIAHENGAKLLVDNTFATSAVARPLDMGADVVVYSATKYLGGHSDIIGGAVVADAENIKKVRRNLELYGAIMGPMEAWLLCRSMRTLDLRVEQHSKNALKVAQFLENHPKIEKVYYPGLETSKYCELANKLFVDGRCGGMLSADIAGGEAGASAFIKALETIKLVPSLASYSTSISYPAKTSHRAYSPEEMAAVGISMGQLRISIGLEDADDIIAEFAAALEQV